jgi:hypothetical protein
MDKEGFVESPVLEEKLITGSAKAAPYKDIAVKLKSGVPDTAVATTLLVVTVGLTKYQISTAKSSRLSINPDLVKDSVVFHITVDI